jgi:hypothetical protein
MGRKLVTYDYEDQPPVKKRHGHLFVWHLFSVPNDFSQDSAYPLVSLQRR